ILDTTFAIVRRVRGGVPIFKPDKGHLHHRLLGVGFTQCQAVLLMYVISALFGLSAIALTAVSYQIAVLILFVVIVAIIYGVRKLGIARPVN
ncbi:MAG: undecaprenyl/decaprenyl-phosphate alpha-N-acetylglucosaminyl 1-phosphate transferase, partial [Selenomonadaceae bacterium]|nr:undecaprenyl/decaprenyl-phosphate alpha-N-acetylglucosaminyl 1-phosphate transferase [Selenomonadaceae bacterium]